MMKQMMMKRDRPAKVSGMKEPMQPAKRFAGKGTKARLNTAASKSFFGRRVSK